MSLILRILLPVFLFWAVRNRKGVAARIPLPIYTLVIKFIAPLYVKSALTRKQTPVTRVVRAIWRAL